MGTNTKVQTSEETRIRAATELIKALDDLNKSEIDELKAQMDDVFMKMKRTDQNVKAYSPEVIIEENSEKFRQSMKKDNFIAIVLAGLCAGASICVLAIIVAGLI